MTLGEKAEVYGMDAAELTDVLMSEPKNKRFFGSRDLSGDLDSVTSRAIDEIMAKHPDMLPSAKGSAFGEKESVKEPDAKPLQQYGIVFNEDADTAATSESDVKFEDNMQPPVQPTTPLSEPPVEDVNAIDETEEPLFDTKSEPSDATEPVTAKDAGVEPGTHLSETTEAKPKAKRTKKKPAVIVEVESEIEAIPSVALRKFYAENFSVKPEKIFYMDDATVKEKVDERYIVIERDTDFLFLKRTAAVISVPKE